MATLRAQAAALAILDGGDDGGDDHQRLVAILHDIADTIEDGPGSSTMPRATVLERAQQLSARVASLLRRALAELELELEVELGRARDLAPPDARQPSALTAPPVGAGGCGGERLRPRLRTRGPRVRPGGAVLAGTAAATRR